MGRVSYPPRIKQYFNLKINFIIIIKTYVENLKRKSL